MELTLDEVRQILAEMEKPDSTCEVDWTYRCITVLGPVREDRSVMLSDGPMRYRDRRFRILDRS